MSKFYSRHEIYYLDEGLELHIIDDVIVLRNALSNKAKFFQRIPVFGFSLFASSSHRDVDVVFTGPNDEAFEFFSSFGLPTQGLVVHFFEH